MAHSTLESEIEAGASPDSALRRTMARLRARLDRHPRLRTAYRATVALLGTGIIAVGVVLLVIPGPGWLMIFLGLGVLGTEFPAARRVMVWTKDTLLRITRWWRARRG